MVNQGSSGSTQNQLFVILALVVLGAVGFYVYRVLFDQYELKPEKVFTQAFNDNVSSVSDLTGGGTISGTFDVWLRFKLVGRAVEFKSKNWKLNDVDKELGREWFYSHCQKTPDPSLGNIEFNNLRFYENIESTSTHITHEWYIRNLKDDIQYYRRWGY
ncbi:MAG: hypothetical protein K2X93_10400 [Candidatus Obscuribacterales bacterium]|nr:hypothetical protein [Candidatus Obscuribacterales bacterium]